MAIPIPDMMCCIIHTSHQGANIIFTHMTGARFGRNPQVVGPIAHFVPNHVQRAIYIIVLFPSLFIEVAHSRCNSNPHQRWLWHILLADALSILMCHEEPSPFISWMEIMNARICPGKRLCPRSNRRRRKKLRHRPVARGGCCTLAKGRSTASGVVTRRSTMARGRNSIRILYRLNTGRSDFFSTRNFFCGTILARGGTTSDQVSWYSRLCSCRPSTTKTES